MTHFRDDWAYQGSTFLQVKVLIQDTINHNLNGGKNDKTPKQQISLSELPPSSRLNGLSSLDVLLCTLLDERARHHPLAEVLADHHVEEHVEVHDQDFPDRLADQTDEQEADHCVADNATEQSGVGVQPRERRALSAPSVWTVLAGALMGGKSSRCTLAATEAASNHGTLVRCGLGSGF